MKLPRGFAMPGGTEKGRHVLKLLNNIYGLKQAGWV